MDSLRLGGAVDVCWLGWWAERNKMMFRRHECKRSVLTLKIKKMFTGAESIGPPKVL